MKFLKKYFVIVVVSNFLLMLLSLSPAQAESCLISQSRMTQSIENFFQWINFVDNPKNNLTLDDINKHFEKNAKTYTNNKLSAEGTTAIFSRYNALRKSYKVMNIKFPLNIILIDGNRAAVYFVQTFVRTDESKGAFAGALFLEFNPKSGKVTKYYDVFGSTNPL